MHIVVCLGKTSSSGDMDCILNKTRKGLSTCSAAPTTAPVSDKLKANGCVETRLYAWLVCVSRNILSSSFGLGRRLCLLWYAAGICSDSFALVRTSGATTMADGRCLFTRGCVSSWHLRVPSGELHLHAGLRKTDSHSGIKHPSGQSSGCWFWMGP